jgi:hypothetical protein
MHKFRLDGGSLPEKDEKAVQCHPCHMFCVKVSYKPRYMGLEIIATWTKEEVISRTVHEHYAAIVPSVSSSQLLYQRLMHTGARDVVNLNETLPPSNKSAGRPGASADKLVGAVDFLALGQ